MSEDERQRQMDFSLNNLTQVSAKVDALADAQVKSDQVQRADAVRIWAARRSICHTDAIVRTRY